ncbi:MAG: DUF4167 domain-containing protein [Rhodospirillaceae bacterium]|nr:DUF4167 domain-containing protein [Rhodospirillaceae bacterium]
MKGRQRGRNGGKPRMHHQGGGGGRNPNFDHNAGRMRGNAQQLMDKYLALARDASSQGDRVLAENYFQHADHYYRVINARFEGQQNNQQRRFNGQPGQDRYDGPDSQGNYQDYNSGPELPPGPSQNLIPPPAMADNQPHVPAAAPQPVYEQQQQQYQPPAQQQNRDEGDIGLPPQLFGNSTPADANGNSNGDAQGNAGGQERGNRPRHAGRRRFAGRSGGQQRSSAEPVDAG